MCTRVFIHVYISIECLEVVCSSNKTGTTLVFCVEYSGGTRVLEVVIGHQVLYPTLGRSARFEKKGESDDTRYRVSRKDSMKIVSDFYYERNVA